jgi:hypothetical protein
MSNAEPPQEVRDLFYEIERLPAGKGRVSADRDVCLGFCHAHFAELGLR